MLRGTTLLAYLKICVREEATQERDNERYPPPAILAAPTCQMGAILSPTESARIPGIAGEFNLHLALQGHPIGLTPRSPNSLLDSLLLLRKLDMCLLSDLDQSSSNVE
ncbi:MAG: hypothetical protein JSW42_02430 [Chloroflexota bacterium]|nr:MAG: hypothetical protein JSW42_02430 [Chloroflexota bacterium]